MRFSCSWLGKRSSRSRHKASAAEGTGSRLEELQEMPLKQAVEATATLPLSQFRAVCQTLIRRCISERALELGKRLHDNIRKHGMNVSTFISNNLVNMYGQCGAIELAREEFLRCRLKNPRSWSIVIAAFMLNRDAASALSFYHTMQQDGYAPDGHLVSAAFCAAGAVGSLAQGKAIYASIEHEDVMGDPVVRNSILRMYKLCGSREDFERAFWGFEHRSESSWLTMIAAKVHKGEDGAAIQLLRMMDLEGEKIKSGQTFTSLLDACGNLSAIREGKLIHERILASGIEMDVILHTALIHMYSKCGWIEEARGVYDLLPEPDYLASTSMIGAFARNGHFDDALRVFWRMEQNGLRGDGITFTHVLYACSHGGYVEQAWHYFTSMKRERGLEVVHEHYGCVIDLLARAGWLAETEEFLKKMPIQPDAVSWMSLLQACRMHRNPEIGARAAEEVYRLAPHRAGPYSLLYNIYSDVGRYDLAAKVQKLMRDRGVKKPGGRSWIEINGKMHEFIVGDSWHPELEAICREIQRMSKLMKAEGYRPDTKQVLHDAEEDEKEEILYFHSEKLAIGLGLIKTKPGSTIKVVKNIRVCPDCHTAAKFISKISKRKIVVRDLNLFHHFEDGKCSCRDYW